MSIYKEAIKQNLRYQTSKGSFTTEQLYDLTQTDLANALKELKKSLKKDDEDGLDFLKSTATKVDALNQLRFDILKDVYLTKKEEKESERTKAENNAHNQKILSLIQEKKEGQLRDMEVSELEKLLK